MIIQFFFFLVRSINRRRGGGGWVFNDFDQVMNFCRVAVRHTSVPHREQKRTGTLNRSGMYKYTAALFRRLVEGQPPLPDHNHSTQRQNPQPKQRHQPMTTEQRRIRRPHHRRKGRHGLALQK